MRLHRNPYPNHDLNESKNNPVKYAIIALFTIQFSICIFLVYKEMHQNQALLAIQEQIADLEINLDETDEWNLESTKEVSRKLKEQALSFRDKSNQLTDKINELTKKHETILTLSKKSTQQFDQLKNKIQKLSNQTQYYDTQLIKIKKTITDSGALIHQLNKTDELNFEIISTNIADIKSQIEAIDAYRINSNKKLHSLQNSIVSYEKNISQLKKEITHQKNTPSNTYPSPSTSPNSSQ